MATPTDSLTSVDRFLQLVARSRLVEHEQLQQAVDQAPKATGQNAEKLADFLVERQYLTHFQAAKLLKGTWQGLVLGPYQVLAPLGRGGMGQVYLARNTEFKKPGAPNSGTPSLVALKVLPPKRAREEQRTLARFLREMEMCRLVSHPHLTKTFDAGDFQGVYYIAMEYIRGTVLNQLIKDNGPLLTPRTARLFSEIAAGLSHAHDKGLIHRDLKPSNIMVTPNGHGKVLDLGLALVVDEELPQDKMIVGGQGYVVGTMDYIAPEQVDDPTQVDARADLYALGCSIYYAMTGQPPFPGGTKIEKMKRHCHEFAAPLSDVNPTVPAAFSKIVERLMEKEPARRYSSAEQVREALLPWAYTDPQLPMDTDPHQTEAEAVEQLEKEQCAKTEYWWESVPVITFAATSKYSTADLAMAVEENAPPTKEVPMAPKAVLAEQKDDVEDAAKREQKSPSAKGNPLVIASIVIAALMLLVFLLEVLKHVR